MGHYGTPGDLADIGFLALSLDRFTRRPTWGNLGGLVVDAFFAALPVVANVTAARRLGKVDDLGDAGRLLPPPSWQGEKWLELKAFYEQQGLSFDGAKFISIRDISKWSGPNTKRIWLGTSPASSVFGPEFRKIPIPRFRNMAGKVFRQNMASIFGGLAGEDALRLLPRRTNLKEDLKSIINYAIRNPEYGTGQIVFNLHKRISSGSVTRWELEYILSNPDIRNNTLFVVDWYAGP